VNEISLPVYPKLKQKSLSQDFFRDTAKFSQNDFKAPENRGGGNFKKFAKIIKIDIFSRCSI